MSSSGNRYIHRDIKIQSLIKKNSIIIVISSSSSSAAAAAVAVIK